MAAKLMAVEQLEDALVLVVRGEEADPKTEARHTIYAKVVTGKTDAEVDAIIAAYVARAGQQVVERTALRQQLTRLGRG